MSPIVATAARLVGQLDHDSYRTLTPWESEVAELVAQGFDLADPAQIPVIAEPLFRSLNCTVEFIPVMNVDDLQRGLEQWAQS
ncbi:hypothetical protein ALI22I_28975 [Saccharothrix sp. ALI-22-I]|uniref:hypothetical protein n=1 Tax=Saccharothrix sp. ALI-22-I TaxID=1933778 RepID=UPI00097C510B|nr:hypothetical protein [Saccharothrix sp. ALI-22-I]ONI84586.1 hypothetical protein ALI22I_28975 [Saccharothrix sp. ALI-22-I]